MRENKLRQHTSFVDELGRAQNEGDQVRSTKAVIQEMVEEYVDTTQRLTADLEG